MSDSVRPHRRLPTRLPHPWDSPGKNTGVGCHFLLQCMKVKSESEVTQSCLSLSDPMDCSLSGSHPWDFPGKSTGVGCHCLLQDVAKNTVFYFRIPRFENDLEYFFSSLNAAKPYLRSLMWKLPINGLKYSMEHYDIKWWKLERWEIRCIQLSI